MIAVYAADGRGGVFRALVKSNSFLMQEASRRWLVPPNYSLYEKCFAAFMNILREYSDVVEQYSIDEAYVDMTASCHLFGQPEEVAEQVKDHIRERLGFTVNVGVSSNKLLAKMASDFKKPDMVHTLYPEEIREKMWPLPVSDLFFVGRATTKKLFSVGIRTIVKSIEFNCTITILEQQINVWLIYYKEENRWVLVYRQE